MAFAFLALTTFATAPSALYGLYAKQDYLAPITLTVYAIYAVGIVVSLLPAGHLSDTYGRRIVLTRKQRRPFARIAAIAVSDPHPRPC